MATQNLIAKTVMKQATQFCILLGVAALNIHLLAPRAVAANRTWSGGGTDNYWGTANNWGGTAPVGGDNLIFNGTTQQNNTNNLATANLTNGWVTFNNGGFILNGNAITLTNGSAQFARYPDPQELGGGSFPASGLNSGGTFSLPNLSGKPHPQKTGLNSLCPAIHVNQGFLLRHCRTRTNQRIIALYDIQREGLAHNGEHLECLAWACRAAHPAG